MGFTVFTVLPAGVPRCPKDLAPEALQSSEGMMKMLFRQHFVRTDSSKGLDKSSADSLIQLLNDEENV